MKLNLRMCLASFVIAWLFSSPVHAQSGSVTANSPCQLGPGASRCDVTLTWSTSNSPVACLWLSNGGLFACSGNSSDSAVWPWTNLSPDEFVLRSHPDWNSLSPSGTELARITVNAVAAPTPSGTISTNSPCTLATGSSVCSVNVSWTKSNTPIACVWLASSNTTFACSGNDADSGVWPWTAVQSDQLILRSHASWSSISVADPELARATVFATAPNSLPSISLLQPAADGFAGHVGQAVSFSANAIDPDGSVQRVDYYANGVLVSQAYPPSFSSTWYPNASGEFAVKARAYDNNGGTADSNTKTIIVAEYGMPTIPSAYGTADQYFPMFAANAKRLTFRDAAAPAGTGLLYSWSIPIGNGKWQFHWPFQQAATLDLTNTSWEEWQVRTGCSGGSEWLYLNSYHGRTTLGYPNQYNASNHDSDISTTRALLDYGGRVWDVSTACSGVGQPYVPRNVSGQPHRIRVWGLIANSTNWYWEARFTYTPAKTNACWQGLGSQTRGALTVSEAWWDPSSNWLFNGSGTMGADGLPNGLNVALMRTFSLGQGAGYAWQLSSSGWNACSENFTDYQL